MKKNPYNKKFTSFFKNYIFTKKTGFISFFILTFIVIILTFSSKFKHPYKPTFFNYQSYMSKSNIDKINKHFNYKEFAEVTEFNKAILTNKAAAGIGSDSYAVQLIKRNKLKKIDYEKIYGPGITSPQHYLTKQIWEHMLSYDVDLTTDYWGNNFETPKHLWEYFLPYYSQDGVIAYNPSKISNKEEVIFKDSSIGANDKYKMINILKTLKNHGYNSWLITDSIRDNLMYGSSYRADLEGGIPSDSEFTGHVDSKTYKVLTDSFVNLINEGTGFNVKDSEHINFKSDGLELLNTLINPDSSANAAIMYNGDGIDAYFSTDNYQNVEDGTIRFIKPEKNLLLVDGFVIANNNDSNTENILYEIAKNSWMYNYAIKKIDTTNANTIESSINSSVEKLEKNTSKDEDGYYDFSNENNPGLVNFDFINYTPTNIFEYNFIKNNYFESIESLQEKNKIKDLYEIQGEHKPIKPISDKLFAEISVYYNTLIKG